MNTANVLADLNISSEQELDKEREPDNELPSSFRETIVRRFPFLPVEIEVDLEVFADCGGTMRMCFRIDKSGLASVGDARITD